jgi:hypothetical protein
MVGSSVRRRVDLSKDALFHRRVVEQATASKAPQPVARDDKRATGGSLLSYALMFVVGAGAGVTGSVLQQHAPETRFIKFGAESTDPSIFASGWSGPERDQQGGSWVWCVARSCSLLIQAHAQRDRLVRLHVVAARFPQVPEAQTTIATLNGAELGKVNLGDAPVIWEIPVAKSAWKVGENVLRFDFTYAEAPAKYQPDSTDTRTLSVLFDWLEIVQR